MRAQQMQAFTRQVKLTFDDGPDTTTTPELLDHLKRLGLKATFFVLGHKIADPAGRAIIERMAADGHQIGNHSYSHWNLTKLSADDITTEITRTERLIGSLDGGVKLFRPPYGFSNTTVDATAKALGYRLVMWNVTSLDWRPHFSNRRWVAHSMRQIKANLNCIVLAHDVHKSTVDHVPELVAAIRQLPDTEFALLA